LPVVFLPTRCVTRGHFCWSDFSGDQQAKKGVNNNLLIERLEKQADHSDSRRLQGQKMPENFCDVQDLHWKDGQYDYMYTKH
jgi:hypothetical protein